MSELRARGKAEIKAAILARIASGESVHAITKDRAAGITERTFWRWIHEDRDFAADYDRATERRGEKFAEEIASIADEKPPLVATGFGDPKIDSGYVQWQKLRIEARQWIAARMLPKRYGARTVLAGDPDAPLVVDDVRAELLRRLGADAPETEAPGMDRSTLQ